MGQRGEFRGEYRLGVTAGELKNKRCASIQFNFCHRFQQVSFIETEVEMGNIREMRYEMERRKDESQTKEMSS